MVEEEGGRGTSIYIELDGSCQDLCVGEFFEKLLADDLV